MYKYTCKKKNMYNIKTSLIFHLAMLLFPLPGTSLPVIIKYIISVLQHNKLTNKITSNKIKYIIICEVSIIHT